VLQLFLNIELQEEASEIKAAVAYNIDKSTRWGKFALKFAALGEIRTSAQEAVRVRGPILTDFARANQLPLPEHFISLFNQYLMAEGIRATICDQICGPLRAIAPPPLPPAATPSSSGGAAAAAELSSSEAKSRILWGQIKRSGEAFKTRLLASPSFRQRVNGALFNKMSLETEIRYLNTFCNAEPVVWSVDYIQANLAGLLKRAQAMSMWHVAEWAGICFDQQIENFKASFLEDVELLQLEVTRSFEASRVPLHKRAFHEFLVLLGSISSPQRGLLGQLGFRHAYPDTLHELVKNLHKNELFLCDFFERNMKTPLTEKIQTVLYRWLGHFRYDRRSGNVIPRDKANAAIFACVHLTFGRLKQWIYIRLNEAESPEYIRLNQARNPEYRTYLNYILRLIDGFIEGVAGEPEEEGIYRSLNDIVSNLLTSYKDGRCPVYHVATHYQFEQALVSLTCLVETRVRPITERLEKDGGIFRLVENHF
jgi:hypothetical protein